MPDPTVTTEVTWLVERKSFERWVTHDDFGLDEKAARAYMDEIAEEFADQFRLVWENLIRVVNPR